MSKFSHDAAADDDDGYDNTSTFSSKTAELKRIWHQLFNHVFIFMYSRTDEQGYEDTMHQP